MTAGRPTDYRPEYCERIIEMGKRGLSVVQMACELDVVRNTMERTWTEEYPEFLIAFNKAKQESQSWWEKVGQEGMFESPGGGKINTGIWSRSMAARFPADWRENSKVEQTLSGPGGGPVETAITVKFVDGDTAT